MKCIASAKYLSPPFNQQDLVSIIIQHFPASISVALRGRSPNTTNKLLSILTEFDEFAPAYESRSEDNNNFNRRDNTRNFNNRCEDNRIRYQDVRHDPLYGRSNGSYPLRGD